MVRPLFTLLLIPSLYSLGYAGALPGRPRSLLEKDSFQKMAERRSALADYKIVPVKGQPFARAWNVTVLAAPKEPYAVQLSAKASDRVHKGDLLHARFYVRALPPVPEDAEIAFVFERIGGDYEKSINFPLVPGHGWTLVNIPFLAAEDYQSRRSQANIRMGFATQSIEIGGFQLFNLRRSAEMGDLPRTRLTYQGRAPGAPWRQEALARIARIRTARLRVTAEDSSGKRLPGARVQVRMLRHAFAFGSAVDAHFLEGPDRDIDVQTYRRMIPRLFNKAVIENSLKWPNWEGKGRAPAQAALKRLKALEIPVRGHALVWPSLDRIPADAQKMSDTHWKLRQRILAHIHDEAGALKNDISEWDVLNEPSSPDNFLKALGESSIAPWFKAAHEAAPKARLFINETGILSRDHKGADRRLRFDDILAILMKDAPPIHGIGLQSHFDWRLTPPEVLLERLDRLSRFGLSLQATEFDVNIADEELQADYLRDFMTALFSHPSVEGIMLWGFWAGTHYQPQAALFREDWTFRPAGRMWLDLVFRRWWTDFAAVTDSRGEVDRRGFLGDYEIEGVWRGRVIKERVTLGREGAAVKLVF